MAITRNQVADTLRARQREAGALRDAAGRAAAAPVPVPADRVVERLVLADDVSP